MIRSKEWSEVTTEKFEADRQARIMQTNLYNQNELKHISE